MVLSMVMSCSPSLCLPRSRMVMQKTIRCSSSVSTASESIKFDLKTYWTTLIHDINQKLDEAVPVHAASLIHDDLPCMDDDTTRRGLPANHTVYGVDMAILAGDALFPLGFQHIVSHTPSDLVPEDRVLRVITEIARAVGSTGMAAGQFLDLEGGPNAVDFVQEKKYGEMGECSAVCGALLAGASDEEIQHMRKYGRAVGVLYQVTDDILEAKKTEDKTEGKKKKGKSYVSIYGVEKAVKVAEDLRAQAKRELDGLEKYGDKVMPLYSFVDYAADRGFSIDGQV
ncbi:heterodimeric geranylgeranyl pyrophosphate synthase small subunit, chloroplastic-like isoform X2 [Solanum dulcamara]|uniref:heterodimeric geranylgeranyl pyrophosphate synthase small subunit, chloroplastic-like isoform X2 n=1 Tax=Solanum dulcamara TaxID=45834 RepID=UPI002484EEDD|nr:heterodimeric geranylgeranyl pyrophosphate synthase small subunit, chloroplastic-like isoform X2 [Solanum dulcamara]